MIKISQNKGFYKKSLECFKFALYIRIKHYGEKHESVADCWFNMAIIYKILSKNFKVFKIFLFSIEKKNNINF